jgi:flagellar hook-length control protein FliK
MQSAIQTVMPVTPQGTTAGTAPGTTGPATTPGAAHSPDSRAAASSDSLPNLTAAEFGVRPNTGPVQMAQMINQAAQSEMRIGMNTAAFGNVEVRTVVHANDVGVLIGSEKGDLRALLANELPGIAASLQQQNLRLNQVNFHQTGFAFSNQMSSGADAQPRSFSSRSMAATTRPAERFSAEADEPAAASSPGSGTGLSILA